MTREKQQAHARQMAADLAVRVVLEFARGANDYAVEVQMRLMNEYWAEYQELSKEPHEQHDEA